MAHCFIENLTCRTRVYQPWPPNTVAPRKANAPFIQQLAANRLKIFGSSWGRKFFFQDPGAALRRPSPKCRRHVTCVCPFVLRTAHTFPMAHAFLEDGRLTHQLFQDSGGFGRDRCCWLIGCWACPLRLRPWRRTHGWRCPANAWLVAGSVVLRASWRLEAEGGAHVAGRSRLW